MWNNGEYRVDWVNGWLWPANSNEPRSLDWSERKTYDSVGTAAIDWENRTLYDSSFEPAVDWENRVLKDAASNQTLDWDNY